LFISCDVLFDEEKMGFADTEQDTDAFADISMDIPAIAEEEGDDQEEF
jgi:hypothetical protein